MSPATAGRTRKIQGFTAIEITAVATIIAILALLLIPLVQERVEKARLTAAQSDLNQLMKAEMLAYADTSQYFRLQDLDNTADLNEEQMNADLSMPWAYWNHGITKQTRDRMAGDGSSVDANGKPEPLWKGPYLAFNKALPIQQLLTNSPYFFWGSDGTGGPIYLQGDKDNFDKDRYPVDPWGSPYIFFGPGKFNQTYLQSLFPTSGVTAPTMWPVLPGTETDFNFGNSVIYSMGPDGTPGKAGTLAPGQLQRPTGNEPAAQLQRRLGAKPDDLMVQF